MTLEPPTVTIPCEGDIGWRLVEIEDIVRGVWVVRGGLIAIVVTTESQVSTFKKETSSIVHVYIGH